MKSGNFILTNRSCPKTGLHKSVIKWKGIQKYQLQNGNLNTVKNLRDLSVMNFKFSFFEVKYFLSYKQ